MLSLQNESFCGDLISIKKQPYGDPNPQYFIVEIPRGILNYSTVSYSYSQLLYCQLIYSQLLYPQLL